MTLPKRHQANTQSDEQDLRTLTLPTMKKMTTMTSLSSAPMKLVGSWNALPMNSAFTLTLVSPMRNCLCPMELNTKRLL